MIRVIDSQSAGRGKRLVGGAFARLMGLLFLLPISANVRAQDTVRTLAGRAQDIGHVDGSAGVSRFSDPAGLAVDSAGNIYVADSANHCVRKLTPGGTVMTLFGISGEPGSTDGTAATARLDSPSAVALGPDGELYISDTGNHTVRRFKSGLLTTLAGVAGESGPTNGPARTARFNAPLGLAVNSAREVFVADSGNHAIRKITPSGDVNTIAGAVEDWGAADGIGSAARFNGPVGIALAKDGSLVVSDSLNHALRRVTPAGTVTTLAGSLGNDGCIDGPASTARFCKPAELQFDTLNNLYVVDAFNHLVRKLTPEGWVSTVAGRVGQQGDTDGVNGVGRFFNPYGIIIRPSGALVVSDTYNGTLREVLAPFSQRIVRTGVSAMLSWESVIGVQYEILIRNALDRPWSAVGSKNSATGIISTLPIADFGTESAPVFFQVRRGE